MARTLITDEQIAAGGIVRGDLNTTLTGSAVIAKVVAGTGISLSQTGVDAGTGDVTITNSFNANAINVTIGDGVNVITNSPAIKCWIRMPHAGTITGVEVTADASGSCVLDIWKTTYATIPATSATKITASAPPTLSSAIKSQDTAQTGWTKTFSAGDYFYFTVTSASTVKQVTLALQYTRTS